MTKKIDKTEADITPIAQPEAAVATTELAAPGGVALDETPQSSAIDDLAALTEVAGRVVTAPADRQMYAAIREMGALLRVQAGEVPPPVVEEPPAA